MVKELRLSAEQFSFYEEALRKNKVPCVNRGSVITLQESTVATVVAALQKQHDKSYNTKTKNITHMERMYHLQQVIERIDVIFPND